MLDFQEKAEGYYGCLVAAHKLTGNLPLGFP
jgi:hypothetical protein